MEKTWNGCPNFFHMTVYVYNYRWDLMDSKIDRTKFSSKASLWEQLETIWKSLTTEKYTKTMPAKGGHAK